MLLEVGCDVCLRVLSVFIVLDMLTCKMETEEQSCACVPLRELLSFIRCLGGMVLPHVLKPWLVFVGEL